MAHGNVIDQFHDQNRLTHTGAAKQANLTAFCIRSEQVDYLNAGDKNFRFGRLISEVRGWSMDRSGFICLDRAALINSFAYHIHDAAKGFRTDRHANGIPRIRHFLSADQTFGRIHGNCPDSVFTQMLRHLQHKPLAIILTMQCIQDIGEFSLKLYVYDGAQYLGDFADILCHFHAPYRVTSVLNNRWKS